jgi:ATP-dependent protease ClpP protease subunit
LKPAALLRNYRDLGLMLAAQNQAREHGWYAIKNAAGEADVYIYGVIGGSFFDEGVDAKQFVQEFRDLRADKIIVRVNSPGGNVDDAVAIHNAIRDRADITETHIEGHALSAASWVGLAANRMVMRPHSRLMIHEVHGVVLGAPDDLRKYADVFDGLGNDIADALAEKAGGTRDEWRERMRAETWYGDQEAVDAGLADEVSGAASSENTFDLSILEIFKNAPKGAKPRKRAPNKTNKDGPEGASLQGPNEELVRAHLRYQRDKSRRLGVAV